MRIRLTWSPGGSQICNRQLNAWTLRAWLVCQLVGKPLVPSPLANQLAVFPDPFGVGMQDN